MMMKGGPWDHEDEAPWSDCGNTASPGDVMHANSRDTFANLQPKYNHLFLAGFL
jgi:hypothetical protein